MKKVILAAILACAAVGDAAALAQPADRAAVEKQIIANERAVLDAFAKRDAACFKSRILPEAFGIDPVAGLVKLAHWEQLMKDAKIESWSMDSPQVHWISADTAILTYKWMGKGTFGAQPITDATWSSTAWVNRGGKWVAVFHQETVAMAAPAKK